MNPKVLEKHYTVPELAFLLGFDRKTVGTWARDGDFGADVLWVKGTDIRVPASAVNAWLERQKRNPVPA